MAARMHLVHMMFHSPITHTALSWASEDDGHLEGMADFGYWQRLARTLERGVFDAVFFADTPAASDQYKGGPETPLRYGVVWPTHDPMPLVAVMAAATERLGLGVTSSVTGTPPYLAYRKLSTLDYMSRGRLGWNVVTGHMQAEHRAIGNPLMEHDERYDYADEYMDVCYALWDSFGEGAILKDRAAGLMADPDRIARVRHEGKYFRCHAVSPTLPSPQGRPVIFQAGSSGRGMQFAVKHAEAVFAIQPHVDAMRGFRQRLDAACTAAGKGPSKILFGLHFVIGSSDAHAQRRLEALRARVPLDAGLSRLSAPLGIDCSKLDPDQPLEEVATQASRGMMESISRIGSDRGRRPTVRDAALQMGTTSGLPQVVGSPERIADEMERLWRESGGFGFNLSAATLPGMMEEFVDHVVPILRRRGLVRGEYTGTTLRDHLES
jgi:FMN-dependent oxidoreductase (nitrilotriacetate monooxygenase family)